MWVVDGGGVWVTARCTGCAGVLPVLPEPLDGVTDGALPGDCDVPVEPVPVLDGGGVWPTARCTGCAGLLPVLLPVLLVREPESAERPEPPAPGSAERPELPEPPEPVDGATGSAPMGVCVVPAGPVAIVDGGGVGLTARCTGCAGVLPALPVLYEPESAERPEPVDGVTGTALLVVAWTGLLGVVPVVEDGGGVWLTARCTGCVGVLPELGEPESAGPPEPGIGATGSDVRPGPSAADSVLPAVITR